ncbi:secreted protein, partial [gut metagenome]
MKKSRKMKLSYVTTLGFLVLGLFSCNDENEIHGNTQERQQPEVEVSNLSEWN